jgi:hypothetical protein
MYSVVIWGASPHMSMAGLRYWRSNSELDSCRPLFKKYEILTVYSLYILECMKYLGKHPEKFRKKSEVPHCISPKTKSAKINSCENDLDVEIEDHIKTSLIKIQ